MELQTGATSGGSAIRAWAVGDKPEHHPLWEEQVALELEMVQRGADKYRAKVGTAREKGEMTRLKAFHQKVEEMVPLMSSYLSAWLRKVKMTRGATPLAYPHLLAVNPDVTSFITIRTILDGATIGNMNLTGTARRIGLDAEYQARMDAWVAKEPDLFYSVQHSLHNQATAKHIRRVNINRFNALMREKLQWQDWSPDVRLHVGLRLIDIAIQSTRAFEVTSDPTHLGPNGSQYGRPKGKTTARDIRPAHVIKVSDDILNDLMNSMDREELRSPQYLPTLIPPKRWNGVHGGGYYTPVVRTPSLIRFHASGELERTAALEEYDALEMPRVQSALSYVQEVPWMVNRKVLAVANAIWERDLAIAGFPKRDLLPLPPKPDDMNTNEVALKDWKREAAKVYGDNARRVSKAMSVRTTLELAEKFMTREFYFPHMLDFRGRMYPIPVYLQPQGNDLARGLLTFAKGQEIGQDGVAWLAIHLANSFGVDKISYEDRCNWVEENEEVWRAIAEDPMRNRQWIDDTDPKHHWQALAAVFEWVRYLDEGPTMVSSLPIHIDGTCNGIQHLSAMMRDPLAGALVNLIPNKEPQDIYMEVARTLQTRLEAIEEAGGRMGELAAMWLNVCDRMIPRSLTKRPVMVLPYGATKEAYFKYVHQWLKEEREDKGKSSIPREEKRAAVPWLVQHMWDAVNLIVVSGQVCMRWLQKAAEVVAQCNQPIVWRTPSGFVVRHFYGKTKSRKAETLIDGKRITLALYDKTADLSKRDQLQGISPNFTHSMDASANTETIIRMGLDNRQPPVTAIHDAYGTVAGAMWQLFNAVRGAFIKVHHHDVLADFRNRCVAMYRDYLLATRQGLDWYAAMEIADDTVPRLPERGSLDINEVAGSDYFFA